MAATSPVDPSAFGWRATREPQGVIATRQERGPLVPVPFKDKQFYAETFGTSSAFFATGNGFGNPDGSGTQVNLTANPGIDEGVILWRPFYGETFGIRWRRDTSVCDFVSVIVDGRAVAVKTGQPTSMTSNGVDTEVEDVEGRAVTHDHLGPGEHLARIVLVSHPTDTRTITLWGLLLDPNAGYVAPNRVGMIHASGTLTNAAVEVPALRADVRAMRSIQKIFYHNTDASARTVTVKSGSSVIKKIYLAADGTDGDSGEIDFGEFGVAPLSSYTHEASATGVVAYHVVGLK